MPNLTQNDLRKLGFSKKAAPLLAAQFAAGSVSDGAPAVPNAQDDEFDGKSTAVWTATPTAPAVWSSNADVAGALHVRAAGSASNYVGKTQPVPGAYPYTITTKLSGHTARANFHRAGGIILAPAGATGTSNIVYCGLAFDTTNGAGLVVARITATLAGTFTSQTTGTRTGHNPMWLKVTVASATSLAFSASMDGRFWMPIETALNPGFTPGLMGLVCGEETALGGVDTVFDFFRVS